jgi:hypothetical protein
MSDEARAVAQSLYDSIHARYKFCGCLECKTDHEQDLLTILAALTEAKALGMEEAANLFENINPYCDHEPKAGAGGMGGVLRFRDAIRARAAAIRKGEP